MNKKLFAVFIFCLIFMFACKNPDIKQPLAGKWQALGPQFNGSEKYLPDEIEFFQDGTAAMPDFPGKKLPFKTELSKEEKQLLKKNYPELDGKNVLLILLDPSQPNWLQNAVVYEYTVAKDVLSLRAVIAARPVKFKRVTSGR